MDSGYTGRVIRLEKDEIKPLRERPPSPDGISFQDIVSKGIAKVGMPVAFKDVSFKAFPIGGSYQQTGLEQDVEFELKRGVIAKSSDHAFIIGTLLTCKPKLNIHGRIGRANKDVIFSTIFEEIERKIPGATVRFTTVQDLEAFFENDIALDFYLQESRIVVVHEGRLKYIKPSSEYYPFYNIDFCPGETVTLGKIPILIDGEFQCFVKLGEKKTTMYRYNYEDNPIQNYIEIRGLI